jgi:hypothetical protein
MQEIDVLRFNSSDRNFLGDTMGKPGIFLLLFVTVALGSPCHDPRLRSATVVGNAIRGSVNRNRKPVRLAQVHLYAAGRLVSSGTTDKAGMLTIDHLSPDKYQLSGVASR